MSAGAREMLGKLVAGEMRERCWKVETRSLRRCLSEQQPQDLSPSWKTGAPGWKLQAASSLLAGSNDCPQPLRVQVVDIRDAFPEFELVQEGERERAAIALERASVRNEFREAKQIGQNVLAAATTALALLPNSPHCTSCTQPPTTIYDSGHHGQPSFTTSLSSSTSPPRSRFHSLVPSTRQRSRPTRSQATRSGCSPRSIHGSELCSENS